MKYNVYSNYTMQQLDDFIGCWYPRENQAQKIYIFIKPDSYEIDYDSEVGGAIPIREHNGFSVRIPLPSFVYSESEAVKILEEQKELIERLQDSFEEYFDSNNNLKGNWDYDLMNELEYKLQKYETEYFWDSENVMS